MECKALGTVSVVSGMKCTICYVYGGSCHHLINMGDEICPLVLPLTFFIYLEKLQINYKVDLIRNYFT